MENNPAFPCSFRIQPFTLHYQKNNNESKELHASYADVLYA
jgi:hypothetical protein